MKLKADFVTNSSSSSFVVIGADLDVSKISEYHMDRVRKQYDKEDYNLTNEEIIEEIREYTHKFTEGTDLEASTGSCYDYEEILMVGIPYTKMGENETLGEFKTRTKSEILNSFGVGVEVGHIEECWMDN
jgi:hypothetical protein